MRGGISNNENRGDELTHHIFTDWLNSLNSNTLSDAETRTRYNLYSGGGCFGFDLPWRNTYTSMFNICYVPEAFAIKVTIFGNTHNQTRVHYVVSHIRLNLGAIQVAGYKTRPSTPSFAHQLHNYIGTLKRNCRQAHDVVLLVGCSKYWYDYSIVKQTLLDWRVSWAKP